MPGNMAAQMVRENIETLSGEIRDEAEPYGVLGEGLMLLGAIGLAGELVLRLPQGETIRAAAEGLAMVGIFAAGLAACRKDHHVRQPLEAELHRLETVLDRAT